MQRKNVQLEVNQEIRYHNQAHKDKWLLNAQGVLIDVNTYSKITYTDLDNVPIEVKWYTNREKGHLLAEIKQPQYTLTFDPSNQTYTSYMTPQGLWEMIIDTQQIRFEESEIGVKLIINYKIIVNDEPLGDYEFQLHYKD
ncbi:DUF1934 family protein [Aerococcaceae bacterium WGS1372]